MFRAVAAAGHFDLGLATAYRLSPTKLFVDQAFPSVGLSGPSDFRSAWSLGPCGRAGDREPPCLVAEPHAQSQPDAPRADPRKIRPGAADLLELFLRRGERAAQLANDTSIGTGFAPATPLEDCVRTLERELLFARGAVRAP